MICSLRYDGRKYRFDDLRRDGRRKRARCKDSRVGRFFEVGSRSARYFPARRRSFALCWLLMKPRQRRKETDEQDNAYFGKVSVDVRCWAAAYPCRLQYEHTLPTPTLEQNQRMDLWRRAADAMRAPLRWRDVADELPQEAGE